MKNKNGVTKKILLVISGVILGSALVYTSQLMRYNKLIPPPSVVEVTPSETYKFIQDNPDGYLFLDVRSLGEYNNLHASTSISFPVADMYETEKRLTIPHDGKRIYLICTSGRLAGIAYRFLEHYGYTNIYHIEGGIQEWVGSGMPVIAKDLFK